MTQHSEPARIEPPVHALCRGAARALAWAIALGACLGACSLDPVATTDKCKGDGPWSENCPQCQTPPFAAECGQCLQSGADPEICQPASDVVVGEVDGGPIDGTSGSAAAGEGAAAGASAVAGAYAAGTGGTSVGPACRSQADCRAPTPACNTTTQKCVACVDDAQCTGGQVCQTLKNRCVDCLGDDDCGACPGGGNACRPKDNGTCSSDYKCVDCEGNRGCTQDKPVCLEKSCVQCVSDADCGPTATGAKQHCDPEHRCVGCTSHADCVAPTPICDAAASHACLGCLTKGDCAAPTPVCDTASTHTCLGCVSDSDCAAPTPACDTMNSHTCLGCVNDDDCAAPTPVCDTAKTHTCLGCLNDSDCGGATPVCDTEGTHTCVGCVDNGDCSGETPLCETQDARACVACLSHADCSAPLPACDPDVHECVECQTSDDCPTAEHARCDRNACVKCTADANCKHLTETPLCATSGPASGACIGCRSDADCGAGTCDFTTYRCSSTRPHSLADCLPCGGDSQCSTASRCVPRQSGAFPGTFCLPLMQGNTCSRPFSTTIVGTPTENAGSSLANACGQPQGISCKAVRASLDHLSCSDDSACGESATDGTCRDSRCTYYCNGDNDCQNGLKCNRWCQAE